MGRVMLMSYIPFILVSICMLAFTRGWVRWLYIGTCLAAVPVTVWFLLDAGTSESTRTGYFLFFYPFAVLQLTPISLILGLGYWGYNWWKKRRARIADESPRAEPTDTIV